MAEVVSLDGPRRGGTGHLVMLAASFGSARMGVQPGSESGFVEGAGGHSEHGQRCVGLRGEQTFFAQALRPTMLGDVLVVQHLERAPVNPAPANLASWWEVSRYSRIKVAARPSWLSSAGRAASASPR